MAPGLHRIFKRQAEKANEEDYEEEEPKTTIATKIFGKHLHKVRVTTTTVSTETEQGTHPPTQKCANGVSTIYSTFLFHAQTQMRKQRRRQ
jgi:hypothetical protein